MKEERMCLHLLFPTPLVQCEVDVEVTEIPKKIVMDPKNWDPRWKNKITGIRTTNDNLHLMPSFKPLVEQINQHVTKFAVEVWEIDPDDIEMSCMWANSHTRSGDTHQNHIHPNSLISGVVYLNVPESMEGGEFIVENPTPRVHFVWDHPNEEMNSHQNAWFSAKTGGVLLFPSWLRHGTLTVDGVTPEDPRIACSFNYVLRKCTEQTMRL